MLLANVIAVPLLGHESVWNPIISNLVDFLSIFTNKALQFNTHFTSTISESYEVLIRARNGRRFYPIQPLKFLKATFIKRAK